MLAAAFVAIAALALWQLITPQGEQHARAETRSDGDGSQGPTTRGDPEPDRESPSGHEPLDDDGEAVDLAAVDPDPEDENNPGAPVESDADATEAERASGAPFTLAEPESDA